MIKKIINYVFFKWIDRETLAKFINDRQFKKFDKSVSALEGSRFYTEAKVFNSQSDKNKIKLGKYTDIRGELLIFKAGGEIIIGDYCYVGDHTRIWSAERISIGNNVLISHNVNIMDTNSHEIDHIERAEGYYKLLRDEGLPKEKGNVVTSEINIEDHVWISFNVIILKGVTIGKGAIIAAGAVVTKNVPPFTVVAGNPGKVIKHLDQDNVK